MAYSTDYMRQWFEGIRDERITHANTATRVGTAFLMLLHYLLDADTPFIRKDQEDQTGYLLKLLAGAVIGESGQIKLNPDGSITCGRINVLGSAIFNELVINHQNVLEGDTYFTDRGIIENVEYLGGGQYRLTMRKMHDNDVVTFHAYDVLRSAMNNLDTARTYNTSWMRVDSVDLASNTMKVTLYDGEDVPGGVNFGPQEAARIIRWGNQVDKDRQQVFFISSEDGRFLFLQGVTKPILDEGNYSAFVGLPPELDFLKGLPINKRQPYIYARGLIVQDIIKVDYQGNPEYTARDRGVWQKDVQYIHGYDEEAQGYFTDRVWWGGCLWQAAVEKPTVGKEPRYNNADWACLIGGANMSMEIYSTNGDAFPANKPWTTTLVAELWNAEMQLAETEIGRDHITWQRISNDAAGDIAWNIQHAQGNIGLRLEIDSTIDCPGSWEPGSQISFQCDIYLPEQNQTYSNQYSILM
ncbi:MAG: hypothetical protein IJ539_05880 [Prevotella sp.]|nr:hypothetical protein [Prevotella sp.]MBR1651847.1 hypothetical protein [Alloprevotella sp.]